MGKRKDRLVKRTQGIPLILKLDISGEPRRWITFEEATTVYWNAKTKWSLGEPIRLNGGTCASTGLHSFLDLPSIIAVDEKGARKVRRDPPITTRGLFKRDLGMCAYCSGALKPWQATKDHVMPVSRGGPNTWQNLVLSCKNCNGLKDNRTPTEAKMDLRVSPYVPTTAELLLYENPKATSEQKQFLLNRIAPYSRYYQST